MLIIFYRDDEGDECISQIEDCGYDYENGCLWFLQMNGRKRRTLSMTHVSATAIIKELFEKGKVDVSTYGKAEIEEYE